MEPCGNTMNDLPTCMSFSEEALVAGDDVEVGYPITCGESKAILLFKKFVCPGINVKCVKVSVFDLI